MMKWIVPALLLATASTAAAVTHSAQADLPLVGQRLEPATHPDGKLAFGVAYSYDADWSWSITYTTTITPAEVAELPETIQWRLVDSSNGKAFSAWQPVSRSQILVSSLALHDRGQIRNVLLHQKRVTLVFATPEGIPLYHLAVGSLCASAETFFMDLTNPALACYAITARDLQRQAGR